MGTLTHDRAKATTPWCWTDPDIILDISDNVMLGLHRLPQMPNPAVANDLFRGGLVDEGMRLTERGRLLQTAYRSRLPK